MMPRHIVTSLFAASVSLAACSTAGSPQPATTVTHVIQRTVTVTATPTPVRVTSVWLGVRTDYTGVDISYTTDDVSFTDTPLLDSRVWSKQVSLARGGTLVLNVTVNPRSSFAGTYIDCLIIANNHLIDADHYRAGLKSGAARPSVSCAATPKQVLQRSST